MQTSGSPRVFVVSEPLRWNGDKLMDLTSAEIYGSLRYVLPNRTLPWDLSGFARAVEAGMADFGPTDYLLPIGDPLAIAVAGAVAADRTDGQYRILQWIRRTQRYRAVEIDHGWCDDVEESESIDAVT